MRWTLVILCGLAVIEIVRVSPAGVATATTTAARPLASVATGTIQGTGIPEFPDVTQAIYVDVTSVPAGGYVTVYGIASGSSNWAIAYQGNGRTVVQAPSNASLGSTTVTVNGTSIPINIHAGRVRFADPPTLASVYQSTQPGDAIYLRGGRYTGKYDAEGWNESNFVIFKAGTASQPISIVAYPGETVTVDNTGSAGGQRPNFHLGDGSGRRAAYLTIAGMNLIADSYCIFGGGATANSDKPEMGAIFIRVVRNSCTITNATANTMTGMIALQGDGWKVIGNSFFDPPNRTIINNNHGIYISNGADDVEVAYNSLRNLHMGHVIQVHQDGTPMLYERINIHDNILEAANNSDMRGITVSNVDPASTITIANNTLRNLGQNFSGIAVYRGVVTITGNKLYDINAPAIMINGSIGGPRSITASGNRFGVVSGQTYFSIASGASASELILNNNSYCGGGPFPTSPIDPAPSNCP